jgi:hypothetical protein
MPAQTAAEFIKSFQGSGVVLVKDDSYYFIPLATLNKCMFPAEFQKNADGISPEYFKPEHPELTPQGIDPIGQVYRKMDLMLGDFKVADGVRQAIWINAAEPAGDNPTMSKSSGSNQTFFRYLDKKIAVDMSKGGKPSNR